MLLNNFSNLQTFHTAGTNLTVADMLSRDFLHLTNKLCQLQHKPNILITHEDVLPRQKIDSHPFLADYGDTQFKLRVHGKNSTITYTTLDSFTFQSLSSFLNKYKNPQINKLKHCYNRTIF